MGMPNSPLVGMSMGNGSGTGLGGGNGSGLGNGSGGGFGGGLRKVGGGVSAPVLIYYAGAGVQRRGAQGEGGGQCDCRI